MSSYILVVNYDNMDEMFHIALIHRIFAACLWTWTDLLVNKWSYFVKGESCTISIRRIILTDPCKIWQKIPIPPAEMQTGTCLWIQAWISVESCRPWSPPVCGPRWLRVSPHLSGLDTQQEPSQVVLFHNKYTSLFSWHQLYKELVLCESLKASRCDLAEKLEESKLGRRASMGWFW